MQLAEIMQKKVITIRPEATVQEAGKEMANHTVNSLVVINGSGKLVGILTNSDIIRNVVASGESSKKVLVSDIMTKDVIIASPEATLEEAANVMVKYKIKHLPVVHEDSVVGIVTTTDLITYEEALIEKISTLLFTKREDDDGKVGG